MGENPKQRQSSSIYRMHASVGQAYVPCYLATSHSSVVLSDLFLRSLTVLLCSA